jgi:hypothetical protein
MNVFITFGGGGQNYIEAGERLLNQAKLTGYFDKLILYTDADLKEDSEFWNQHSDFISNHQRGYGYWLWKSYIIKKTMTMLNDGDTLMYLDCGCEIGGEKQLLIPSFLKQVKEEYVMGTEVVHLEKHWNKMDLVIHLNMQDSNFLNTPQHQAGALLFHCCNKTKTLVDEWYSTCCTYHLIDDSPSTHRNAVGFKEHRHDQSVFSLLTKKYALLSQQSLHSCVHYSRNRTGVSRL